MTHQPFNKGGTVMNCFKVILTSFILCFFFSTGFTQIPLTMSYQGTLTNDTGQPVANGDYSMTFRIYEVASGGSSIWEETQTVPVTDGIFNAILGSSNPLDITFDNTYWLGVTVAEGDELQPRVELTSSAYSLNAHHVSGTSNVFPGDGNVGIGIKNPAAKLEVDGNWSLGITGIFPDGSNGRIYSQSGIYSEAGGTDWAHYFTAFAGGDIARFATGTLGEPIDTKVVIRNSGNVGIGSTDPADPLEVAGIISSTDGGFRFPDNSVQTSAAGGGTGNGNTLDQAYDQGGAGAGRIIEADSGPVDIYGDGGLNVEGSVGIGTLNPAARLEVADYPTGTNEPVAIRITNQRSSLGLYWELRGYDSGSGGPYGRFSIFGGVAGGADRFVVTTTGNIGIGTIDPVARLEVIGVGGSNSIQASSSAGGGYSAGHFSASGSGTYGIWAQSSDYDAIYATSSSSSHAAIRAVSAGPDGDAIYADGNISYTGELIHVVDNKFLENIRPMNDALTQITSLKVRAYQFTADPQYSELNFPAGTKYGFVSQELKNVIPELVSKNALQSAENTIEYEGVNYVELIPILVKAVQEQQEIIEQLQAQIQILQTK
jgi:hypothetical protein